MTEKLLKASLQAETVENFFYAHGHICEGVMHQSFISTAPTYGDSCGIARLRCRIITF